jgi:membrane fusion protein (multidrug efflux system)
MLCVVATAAFGAAEPRPSVIVLTLEPRSMTPALSITGRVVAVEKVDMRARVSGFIKEVHVIEREESRGARNSDIKRAERSRIVAPLRGIPGNVDLMRSSCMLMRIRRCRALVAGIVQQHFIL